MAIKFVQEGRQIDYTPAAAVAVGVGVVVGSMFGVTTKAIDAAVLGSLAIDGVFEFAKTAGGAITFTQGAKVYFVAATQLATSVATGNTLIGLATSAAVDGDAVVKVRLQPMGA